MAGNLTKMDPDPEADGDREWDAHWYSTRQDGVSRASGTHRRQWNAARPSMLEQARRAAAAAVPAYQSAGPLLH